jgi:WD40 repeat protein
MWRRWLIPRFSIRTLLLLVAAIATGLWSYLYLPDILRNRQDRLSRAAIDPYELSIAGNGDPAKAPVELVAILGDSRLKHWWRVYSLPFLDKSRLFTYGQDGEARIWDVKTGRQVRSFAATVAAASQLGDKLFLGSSSAHNVVEVWDTTTWKPAGSIHCQTQAPIIRIVASPSGTRLAVALQQKGQPPVIEIWDAVAPKLLHVVRGPWSRLCLAFDDAGSRLVMGDEQQIRVVDVESGAELGSFDPFAGQSGRAAVYVARFDKEEDAVVTGDAAGTIVIWNYVTGKPQFEFPHGGGDGMITELGFNKDMSYLTASQNQGARTFVRKKGGDWVLLRDVAPDEADRASIAGMVVGPGLHAFGCHDHTIVLADGAGPLMLTGGKRSDVTCLGFDPEGNLLATSGRDGQITLWKTGSWRPVRTWEADREALWQLAFAPNGDLLSGSRRGIVVWNPATGAEVRTISPRGFFHDRFAISLDGQFVAAPDSLPGAPYSIGIWNLASGAAHKTISNANPAAAERGELAFDASGKQLVVGGGKGITVWDVVTGKLTANLGNKTLHDVPLAMHEDGQRVAMAPWRGPVELWDLGAKKLAFSANVHGAKAMVYSIAIHPRGKWAASAADDGTASLWDFDTGAVVKSWQLGPAKGIVFQVAFSPDGRYLATVNGNGTAYILRIDGIAGKSHPTVASSGGN